MAKNQSLTRKRSEDKDRIDNIAKYSPQPRSLAPKRRRTDFTNLLGFSPSSLNEATGSPLGSSCDKDGLSNVTATSVDDSKDKGKELSVLPLVRCSMSQSKEMGVSSSSVEFPVLEAESVSEDTISDPRNDSEQKSDAAAILESTPKRSQVTDDSSARVAPGSIVWAKAACQMWWPAEIMDERSTLAESGNQGNDGFVLVQFYGNLERAWVDPATDISQLEDCFEERSCNSSEGFQDALKQALHGKEHLSSCRKLLGNLDGCSHSNQQDHSPDGRTSSISSSEVLETWRKKRGHKLSGTSSISSKPASDAPQTRRGKRERKPKVQFGEPKQSLKSKGEARRIRIMRHLGLKPPIGSPY